MASYWELLAQGLKGLGPGIQQYQQGRAQQVQGQQAQLLQEQKRRKELALQLLKMGYQPTEVMGMGDVANLPEGTITPESQLGQTLGLTGQTSYAPRPPQQMPVFMYGQEGLQQVGLMPKGGILRPEPKPQQAEDVAPETTYAERIQKIYSKAPQKFKGMEETTKGFTIPFTETKLGVRPTKLGQYILSELRLIGLPKGIKYEDLDVEKIISDTERVMGKLPPSATKNEVNILKRKLNTYVRNNIKDYLRRR